MKITRIDWSSEDYDGLFKQEIPLQLLQNPLLNKEVWKIKEDLGLDTLEHRKVLTIRFNKIEPLWLKLLTKLSVQDKSLEKSLQSNAEKGFDEQ